MVQVHARVAILERRAIVADYLRMNVTPGRIFGLVIAAVVSMDVLSAALRAAGKGVALGVAIAALAAMVLSYVRIAVLVVRAHGDERQAKRVRAAARVHMAVMCGGPLVVSVARPWGDVSIAIGFGAMMLLQVVFLHWIVVAGMVLQRRARRTRPLRGADQQH